MSAVAGEAAARLHLDGGGDAGERLRAADWGTHRLGAPEAWPVSLKALTALMLSSSQAMAIVWGEARVLLYNDAYAPILGRRHPEALGRPHHQVWPELRDEMEPLFVEVYGGRPVQREEMEVAFRTPEGGEEKGWFNFSYTPVRDDAGTTSGLFAVIFDVSGQVRARVAQQASDSRLEEAMAVSGGIGMWAWDVAQDRVTSNAPFARMYGVEPEVAAAGAPLARFFADIHPQDAPRVRNAIQASLSTGGAFAAEYRLVSADGAVRWIAAQGRPVLDGTGRATRLNGMSFEITGRKASETARMASDARLQAVFEAAPVGIVIAETPSGRVVMGNRRAEEILRHPILDTPDVESHGLWEAYHANGRRVAADEFPLVRTVLTGEPAVGEYLYARGDGVQAWVRLASAPVLDPQCGGLIGAVVAIDDVDARRRAEAALHESEAKFRAITNSVEQMIWSTRPDGFHDYYNDRWYEYTGVSYGSTDGDGWSGLFHPDDQPRAWEVWGRCLATGEPYHIEYRLRRADGVYRWVLGRAQAVRDDEGRITRWFGTCTEIQEIVDAREVLATSRERLEAQVRTRTAELMKVEEALRQAQKMEAVGQLTGGIAHDFNNLLTGITGSLELLQIRLAQGRVQDIDRYATAAQGAARRAAALTHRLLAFSRRQTLDPKPVDVNRLVGGMEDLLRRSVGPHVSIEVVGAAGLWTALVDPNQLENALLNLVINARDAMPQGGHVTIETANKWLDARAARDRDLEPGQYLSLCVTDTGAGMSEQVKARAFDPFFTTKPMGEGTGLGLSMIYGFARQSGGAVRIYSELGEGTTLCLYLPRHSSEASEPAATAAAEAAPRAGDGETVLVVDDEPTVRMLVVEVLQDLGYAALEACDGAEALALLQSPARIDLLVTDVGLPGGMNGRQVADAARIRRPKLKVLFITGYAENAVIGAGRLEPGLEVMTKPFAMDALAARIRSLIAD